MSDVSLGQLMNLARITDKFTSLLPKLSFKMSANVLHFHHEFGSRKESIRLSSFQNTAQEDTISFKYLQYDPKNGGSSSTTVLKVSKSKVEEYENLQHTFPKVAHMPKQFAIAISFSTNSAFESLILFQGSRIDSPFWLSKNRACIRVQYAGAST